MVGIVKLEHGEHGDDFTLELDDVFVTIRFVEPGGVEATMPPDQLEKWQQIAQRQCKTVEEVVKAALAVAFSKIDDLTIE